MGFTRLGAFTLILFGFVFASCRGIETSPKVLDGQQSSESKSEIPAPTPAPTPTPSPANYDFIIEVFSESIGIPSRLPGAIVTVDGETKTADGNGFVHFFKAEGTKAISISAAGYMTQSFSYELNRPHTETLPSTNNPSHRVALIKTPPAFYDFVIEVFERPITSNRRIRGALIKVDMDTRNSDGNGFSHFWAQEGVKTIEVTANGYLPYRISYTLDRPHTGTYPSNSNPSLRLELDNASPCTTNVVNDSNTNTPRPLPNVRAIIDRVDRENPGLINQSCVEQGGNNDFLFRVVAELRKTDPRWGVNWKRGNIGDMSQDVINYYRGPGPFADQSDTYVVDIIGGHCGPNPVTAFNDVTCYGTGCPVNGARWTIDPIRKCP